MVIKQTVNKPLLAALSFSCKGWRVCVCVCACVRACVLELLPYNKQVIESNIMCSLVTHLYKYMLFIIIVTAAEARQFANAYRAQKKHTAFSFQKKAVEAALR